MNRLPGPDALPGDPEAREGALLRATIAAEMLLGEPIRPRRLTHECLLGGVHRSLVLPWHPVAGADLDGARLPARGLQVDRDLGVLIGRPGLPADRYAVSFDVGHEEGSVPELACELVRLLALRLLGEAAEVDEDAGDLLALAEAGRSARARARGERARFREEPWRS